MRTVAGIGGSLVRARTQQVKSISVRLPGIDEQRRIAAILDRTDVLRAMRRRAIDRLDGLAQSIFLDMFGDPGSWRARWPMGSIGDTTESVQYGTSAKAGSVGRLPILRMGNVTDRGRLDVQDLKYVDLSDADIPKYTTRRGDLLFNRTNSKEKVGKSCVVRTDDLFAIAGYLVRVRFKTEHNAEFVCAYLTSRHGSAVRRRLAKAAVNQANINASELCRIPIALPPAALQHEFARRVDQLERQRAIALRALALQDELFASLQSRAFRGEL
ncbi:MAG: restriction endonuclease subunit S [Patulibacter sp.]|nr:restriction endonuclease subunit S [Patulibacter sp.]